MGALSFRLRPILIVLGLMFGLALAADLLDLVCAMVFDENLERRVIDGSEEIIARDRASVGRVHLVVAERNDGRGYTAALLEGPGGAYVEEVVLAEGGEDGRVDGARWTVYGCRRFSGSVRDASGATRYFVILLGPCGGVIGAWRAT